jgi:hypothetical protein
MAAMAMVLGQGEPAAGHWQLTQLALRASATRVAEPIRLPAVIL